MSDSELAVYNALSELRSSSLSIQPTLNENSWRFLMDKYNMLFLGRTANTVYANELRYALKNYWHVDLDISAVLSAVPSVCSALGMKYHALIEVKRASEPNAPIAEYSIELF